MGLDNNIKLCIGNAGGSVSLQRPKKPLHISPWETEFHSNRTTPIQPIRKYIYDPPLQRRKEMYDAHYGYKDMTLCIGALAIDDEGLPCIVLCHDHMVAVDEFGSESEHKFRMLSKQMVVLFAGVPGHAKELGLIYQEYLSSTVLKIETLAQQLKIPISDFKKNRADSFFGTKMGLTYQEILDNGSRWFGETYQKELLSGLADRPLGVELIIAGFVKEHPVLCRLSQSLGGELGLETNFAMIGSGAYTAEPTLHARNHTFSTPIDRAIYNVFEAKKLGESSPFVGSRVTMYVLRKPSSNHDNIDIQLITPDGIKHLERLFKKYGPKPTPNIKLPDGVLGARFRMPFDFPATNSTGRPNPE
jgi:hypothetical protein